VTSTPDLSPSAMRAEIRAGRWRKPTSGCCPGHAQANLVVVPRAVASDFLLFCQRNPRPCPLIEITPPGHYEPRDAAPGADLRTDLPRYRIYRHGELRGEGFDLVDVWRDDLVSFLLGCSFTFEAALRNEGLPIRHIEEGKNVPMYVTSLPCEPAGPFRGPMVVSMRPIPGDLVARAEVITAPYGLAHGAPVHAGNPEAIGIADLGRPDFGDPVSMLPGEVPVFWACGVTPQAVAMRARPELMITHAPGHMFITDLADSDLCGPVGG